MLNSIKNLNWKIRMLQMMKFMFDEEKIWQKYKWLDVKKLLTIIIFATITD
ncbi:hypothetical protein HYE37_02360 [Mycoplasmopsis bovis]|nr:hypothetical protein [Mycoplasmopsis bovis]QQH21331.1 hypothetical protein HYE37_02360 [Mycoplasmopsis bovis]